MASYAVTARVDRVQPHLAAHERPRPMADRHAQDELVPEAIDLQRPTSDRWERIRERWAQTTFYLFDPESWR